MPETHPAERRDRVEMSFTPPTPDEEINEMRAALAEGGNPFRVEITAPGHPHRGVKGTCDPTQVVKPILVPMALVIFDNPDETGVECCYAEASAMRKLENGESE